MTMEYTYEQLLAIAEKVGASANGSHDPNGPWEPPTPLVDWVAAYGSGDDPVRWLAEPLLPDQGAVAIFAKGGTGKSLLALWLAAGLATGHGITGPVDAVEVLYLDYEMTLNTVVERLEDMGYDNPGVLKRLHYASLPSLAPLDSKDGGRAVVDMAVHLGVALVVIDTFGRAVHGEEDRADTVQAWYRWTGQLLKAAGVGFLRIDHAGKDVKKGQRGTSAKNDDVDVVWEMAERGAGEYVLRATKRRVSWVDERVVLTRTSDHGVLAYRWTDQAVTFLAGTKEVAELLDELGAPLDISRRQAMTLLRSSGHGKGNNLVGDALRYRRDQVRPSGTGTTSGEKAGTGPVPPPTHDTEPQVVTPEDHPVPPTEHNPPGVGPYEVGPPGGAGVPDPPKGLFDPSTDPDLQEGQTR